MKKIKKIFAVLLSLAMVMGMSMTTFAAEGATIKVLNAENAQLSYVQVIKADPTTKTGWAFTSDDIKEAYLSGFDMTDDQKVITELIAAAKDSSDGKANTEQISKALSNVFGNENIIFETMANPQEVSAAGVYAIHGTEEGYTYNNMAAYVGFGSVEGNNYPTLQSAELAAKKAPTTVVKDNNDTDDVVAIGDTVTFTVKAFVPFINANDLNKTFFVYDRIKGATYSLDDATITVGNESIDSNKIIVNDEGTGFSIDLTNMIDNRNSRAGQEVIVTYDAIVTDVTVSNEAAAGHKGNSDFGSTTTTTYTGQITLTKYNQDGSEQLAGAGFEVTKEGTALRFTAEDEKKGVYVYDPEGTITEVLTGTEGTLVVKGLNVGKYHFEEKTAPEGYSINADGVDATLSIEGQATSIITDTTSLNDTKLSALPSTGGIGTTIFTIGGCLIMIVAAGLFFANRKKSNK